MLEGIYQNPTTIFLGKGYEEVFYQEIKKYSDRILLLCGTDSFKRYGLHERVTNNLLSKGISFTELSGVKTNPTKNIVYKGIDICRKEKINFILAVGGGSVIDTAKAIAIGVPYKGDFFDFFERKTVPQTSLKVATILTVIGSGSESSCGSVITNEYKRKKYVCSNPIMYPVFSWLNPEHTLSVPNLHFFSGLVDAITHILERYFSNTTYVDCTDRLCEGLLTSLFHYLKQIKQGNDNYDIRLELMWLCKLAHDNTVGFGRKQDWACHKISHEIGARYDISHGAILSVIFPAWMSYVSKLNDSKLLQLSERVFKVNAEIGSVSITQSIKTFKDFLKELNMPATLRNIGLNDIEEISDIAICCIEDMPSKTIGNYVRLNYHDIKSILLSCY